MPWAVFLGAIVGSLAKRVAIALGFGVVSFVGFEALKGAFEASLDTALGGMGTITYQLFALAGGVDLIGIWLGALTTSFALMSLKRLTQVA